MAKEEKPNKGRTASGEEQAESREAHSDRVFPQRRSIDQLGTHGGPARQKPPSPAPSESEEPNRK
jgi:hypothetical protein